MKAAATARMFYRQAKREEGFTLVELITVVAIISLLVVYITIEIGRSNDDAKIGVATTFLLANVPSAISSYKARHLNTCAGLNGLAADPLKDALTDRGLVPTTPWNEDWTVAYNHPTRVLTITFPLTGSDDVDVAGADLVANLTDQPQITGIPAYANPNLTVSYDCI